MESKTQFQLPKIYSITDAKAIFEIHCFNDKTCVDSNGCLNRHIVDQKWEQLSDKQREEYNLEFLNMENRMRKTAERLGESFPTKPTTPQKCTGDAWNQMPNQIRQELIDQYGKDLKMFNQQYTRLFKLSSIQIGNPPVIKGFVLEMDITRCVFKNVSTGEDQFRGTIATIPKEGMIFLNRFIGCSVFACTKDNQDQEEYDISEWIGDIESAEYYGNLVAQFGLEECPSDRKRSQLFNNCNKDTRFVCLIKKKQI